MKELEGATILTIVVLMMMLSFSLSYKVSNENTSYQNMVVKSLVTPQEKLAYQTELGSLKTHNQFV